MEKKYLFRREDNDEIISVPWEVMQQQDVLGYITLEDGVQAKRCVRLEMERDHSPAKREKRTGTPFPPPSDALGFPIQALAEREKDRIAGGFTDIEFKPDPLVPEFMQVHFRSYSARDRYAKHCGLHDQSGTRSVAITPNDIRRAEKEVKKRYGEP